MGSVIGQKIDDLTIIPRARMGCESVAHEAEVWEQAEYSALRKENTQCITNVPDTQ